MVGENLSINETVLIAGVFYISRDKKNDNKTCTTVLNALAFNPLLPAFQFPQQKGR